MSKSIKGIEVTPDDYLLIVTLLSTSFLEIQANYTHTFIFRNRLYVVTYEPIEEALKIENLKTEDFYKFLGEFAMFALEATLGRLDTSEINLITEDYKYTIWLFPDSKLGIKKVPYKKKERRLSRPTQHKVTSRRERHDKKNEGNTSKYIPSPNSNQPKRKGTTARRKNNGTPARHQGVKRGNKTGYVYGDRCSICREPLYTAKDDLNRKWCSDPTCRSHRR